MVAALKRLGFHKVYDTNFAADLTIMEEGTELLGRIQNGGKLPMITSCSPGWINYAEYNYGDLLGHLSSCKSPHQMQGAVIKSYYAERALTPGISSWSPSCPAPPRRTRPSVSSFGSTACGMWTRS